MKIDHILWILVPLLLVIIVYGIVGRDSFLEQVQEEFQKHCQGGEIYLKPKTPNGKYVVCLRGGTHEVIWELD